MRRSRRADADTPRDTPGNVEAVRAAANAASSEGSESDELCESDGISFRVASSPRHRVLSQHSRESHTRIHFPLDHAPGEDTLLTNRKVGRSAMDDEAGSVSSEIRR